MLKFLYNNVLWFKVLSSIYQGLCSSILISCLGFFNLFVCLLLLLLLLLCYPHSKELKGQDFNPPQRFCL